MGELESDLQDRCRPDATRMLPSCWRGSTQQKWFGTATGVQLHAMNIKYLAKLETLQSERSQPIGKPAPMPVR